VSSNPLTADPSPIRLRSVPIEPAPSDSIAGAAGKNLPRSLTSLIGRDADVAAACNLLLDADTRLLTLTGPGGVGKTRLALRIAEEAATSFPDGVVYVPLAPIAEPGFVLPAIARELGLRDVRTMGPRDLIIDVLCQRRLLLVLDNFEQVRAAAPELATLLTACAELVILVTSRVSLRVSGEQQFPVSPLALPEHDLPDQGRISERRPSKPRGRRDCKTVSHSIERSAAVQLFVARAQAIDPHFALDAENAAAIAAVCQRLDGLPLAIELAAARIPMLSPVDLRLRFDRALPYLGHGPIDAPHRQRTMRQAIAWSYELLSPAEQALFRRLAVFVGGFSLEAAEWVGGRRSEVGSTRLRDNSTSDLRPPTSDSSLDTFELVSALLDHSLLRRIAQSDGAARFSLLETVREFGLEELAASGEEQEARDAHAAFCLALAERAEPELQDAAWEEWVDRLVSELPNLGAALTYLRECGKGEWAVRLAGALCLFWTQPAYVREGREWLEMAISLPGADRVPAALAKALNAIGVVADWQNDIPRVQEALERALTIRQALGDELDVAEVLGNLGNAALDSGDLERAEALLAESLPIYERHGRTFWAGETLVLLGHTVRARGEYDCSVAYLEQAVAVLRQLPGKNKLSDALISLGWAELMRGELAYSRAAYREGLALAEAGNDRMRMGRGVCGAAGLAAAGGAAVHAARLFGAAAAQRDIEQIPLKPTIQAEVDRLTAGVQDVLGEAAFAAAWAAGRGMPLEDAVIEANAVLSEDWTVGRASTRLRPYQSANTASPGNRLTPREWEVLRLLAAGQSDKEIAAALFISSRTASAHVAAIIAKLGVSSRAAAAVIAARDLLV
jgi:predicted ATPase/DNA-binding CsgD family transcriptional regulator